MFIEPEDASFDDATLPFFFCGKQCKLFDLTVLRLALDVLLCCSTSELTTVLSSVTETSKRTVSCFASSILEKEIK